VLKSLKRSVKTLARHAGLDVRKLDLLAFEHHRLQLLLSAYQIDLVLDIGANIGQWASELRREGFPGDIISFEPLGDAHRQLIRNARKDPKWTVAPRMALGDRNADVQINIAGNSFSSSLLPMLPEHVAGAPESAFVGSEFTPMTTLDSLTGSVIPSDRQRIFCKLDVQGFEGKVLAGASDLMKRIIGVQMEMSLAQLYEGQSSFSELLNGMTRSGFEVFGFVPGFVDPASGRMLQIDGIFFKKDGRVKSS
jgi:FkbM family methyltransferase